jgi:hypothetical protein
LKFGEEETLDITVSAGGNEKSEGGCSNTRKKLWYYSGELGHYKRDCKKHKRYHSQMNQANFVGGGENDGEPFDLCRKGGMNPKTGYTDHWFDWD